MDTTTIIWIISIAIVFVIALLLVARGRRTRRAQRPGSGTKKQGPGAR